jgi:hypothetical protein
MASIGLSEELPKNGDVPKSPLSAIGSLNAAGRHENLLKKKRPWFVGGGASVPILHIRVLAARVSSCSRSQRRTR